MSAAVQMPATKATSRSHRSWAPASPEIPLTAKQKKLIRASYQRLEPARDLVAQLFFLKLFRLDPSLRKRFAGPVEVQARKFSAAMKLTVISLNHEDGLIPTLKLLGVRHRQLGIKARHYRIMAQALTWTLEQSLEEEFTRQTKEAWNTLLSHLTRVLGG
ncbi:MAG: globin domain-containing protein [Methyloceanibacter sp.]